MQVTSFGRPKDKHLDFRPRHLFCLILFYTCLGVACRTAPLDLPYYDATTYRNLTDLKPEVVELYETFSNPTVDPKAISSLRLRLSQIYEYENGKGTKNQETLKQVAKVREMFLRHVNERRESKPWSDTFKADKMENISKAFDIAIQSETLKNRQEDLK